MLPVEDLTDGKLVHCAVVLYEELARGHTVGHKGKGWVIKVGGGSLR